ncbi:MAG: LysM peptidoglycan-binding domain-containing protein [Phycisphaerales bacterium]|nr:LysM peptidoglycan-binding domain-containing protein [Phycisphaerales bacterium]
MAGIWFRDTSKWQLIADINPGLKPSTLKVGQKINLPAKSGKSVTKVASTTKSSAVLTAANEHVVASGETLASISDKAYGNRSNWKRIYEANKGVIGSDPSRLKVGTKLTIPSKS